MKIIQKYYYVAIIVILGSIFLVVSINGDDEKIIFNPVAENEQEEKVKYIYVDIKGEVMNPGVYKVKDCSRLFQLISLAGGITGDADIMAFNLSLKLRDEQVIYIPSISEEYPMITEIIENDISGIININTAS
ncbi:MAG: SLBB domain-containing protein [Candidatus Izimaplasma sp.]|nr:SLBB domain-containing protein [Candidatus Izimaplasma bacterium]